MEDHGIAIAECLDRGTETPCIKANAALISSAPELYQYLAEMREALAAAFRVIAQVPNLSLKLEAEFKHIGLKDGIGVRAQNALAKAEFL